MKNDKNKDPLRELLGKLMGAENVPDDCVLKAILNDQRLQKLAEYDLTKGYTNMKVERDELEAKFAEFKNTVKTKRSTLAELETTVFTRWGIMEKPREQASQKELELPDMSNINFAEHKPITGFAQSEKKPKEKGA